MLKNIKTYAIGTFAICTIAFLLLIYKINELPGFHGDESWVVLRVYQEISQGKFSWSGMNYYTGSLHAMLVAPFLMLFGYSVTVSRLLSLVMNIFSLFLIIRTTKVITRSNYLSLCIGLWTMTMPVFLMDSRFAIEILALNPMLLSLGAFYLSRAFCEEGAQKRNAVFAGIFFALASYSHGSSLYIPIGISLGSLLVYRKKAILSSLAWISGLSFSGLFIFLSLMRGWGNRVDSVYTKYVSNFFSENNLKDLSYLGQALFDQFDGTALYQRYLGSQNAWSVPVLAAGLAFLLAIFRIGNWFYLLAWILGVCLTALSAPSLGTNYFHFWVFVFPMVVFVSLRWNHQVESSLRSRERILILFLVPLLQFVNVGRQYYFQFERFGVRPSVYTIGSRLFETSNHFLNNELLFQQLLDKDVTVITGDQLLVWDLQVRSLQYGQWKTIGASFPERLIHRNFDAGKKTAFLAFNSKFSWARVVKEQIPHVPFPCQSGVFVPVQGFDDQYLVWMLERK